LQVNPALSFVVLNNADNTTGKIRLVASQQGQVPGLTGDVTLLSFEATATNTPGSVTLGFENVKLSDAQAQGFEVDSKDYSISITETTTPEPTTTPVPPTTTPTSEPTATPIPPTTTPTPEPTSEPTATPTPTTEPTNEPTPQPTSEPMMADISGQVIVIGRANNDWSDTMVTIEGSGKSDMTDVTGNFSITEVAAETSSSITADAAGYLSARCDEITIDSPETVLSAVNLLSGDINDDDMVDITDATAVGAGFGQTGSDLPADITRDTVLDIFDIVLVSVNFGEQGPQTWDCLAN
jgi:hypothetical protein